MSLKKKNIVYEISEENTFIKTTKNDNIVTVTLNSEFEDGTIIKFQLFSSDLENLEFGCGEVKNGVAFYDFELDDKWNVKTLESGATVMFNDKENPQPENIINIYGSKGEKLTGSLINTTEAEEGLQYFCIASKESIIYPNQEAFDKAFELKKKEVIEALGGVVIGIQFYDNDGFKEVNVYVSDSWYYSMDYEKERFAENIQTIVLNLYHGYCQVDKNDHISVRLYDSCGIKLAEPKAFGGYKILR